MENKVLRYGIPTVVTLAFCGLYFYLFIPAINLRAIGFWLMLFFGFAVFMITHVSLNKPPFAAEVKEWFLFRLKGSPKSKWQNGKKIKAYVHGAPKLPKCVKLPLTVAVCVLCAVLLITWVTSTKLFRASKYQSMLNVVDADFTEDIAELPISQIPVVDRDTAERLGSRKIGEVVELVSQFNVSDYYSQINYKDKPFRVSPLEYAGFLKWLSNKSDGIPYYVSIDMATQETELVKLGEGMKYSPSEFFKRDLNRHIRMEYPTKMFENLSFEINDEGHPYWVMSCFNYTFGLFGGKDIEGIVLVDAVSGESEYYELSEVPQWIDLAYSEELAVTLANNWGSLKRGYLNSIFVQKEVVVTTEGYSFIANDDDVWLYTGITSVVADESNIGFILINMRTKEAKTYSINGAEEYSAMSSAEGKIQEKGYTSTFPILINVEDKPSYFMSLKDNAGLVKAYAFVSVTDYQIVGVGDTIDQARSEYLRMLGIEESDGNEIGETAEFTGTVEDIATAVKNGNSLYYIMVDGKIYTADISVSDLLPFIKVGDSVTFAADENGKIATIGKTGD